MCQFPEVMYTFMDSRYCAVLYFCIAAGTYACPKRMLLNVAMNLGTKLFERAHAYKWSRQLQAHRLSTGLFPTMSSSGFVTARFSACPTMSPLHVSLSSSTYCYSAVKHMRRRTKPTKWNIIGIRCQNNVESWYILAETRRKSLSKNTEVQFLPTTTETSYILLGGLLIICCHTHPQYSSPYRCRHLCGWEKILFYVLPHDLRQIHDVCDWMGTFAHTRPTNDNS